MSHRPRPRARGAYAMKAPAASDLYTARDIIDAPEHHEYARAMGLLTWGTWDTEKRPFEGRLDDFLRACPPDAPARFQGTMLTKSSEGDYGPAPADQRLARLRANDNSFGTLAEILARYGLKHRSGPEYTPHPVEISPFREITRLRNVRLRSLHGQVDVEPENMDEAKAAEIDRLEKKQAAEEIRAARERMRADITDGSS
jgi:hypothetical protein